MADKRKLPELRFKEYSGEWSDSKLEEMVSFSKGRGYSKSDLTDVGTQIILYGRLYTNYQTVISEVNSYTIPKINSVFSKGNEVIIPSSGESAEDIARASVIGDPNILIGGDLNVLLPTNDIDSVFLAYNISNGNPKTELGKKAQGKTVVHLHNSDLHDILISYPKKLEQFKIATFFQDLDSLISLRQRKYDKLTIVKKAMLEKMFPKDGADAPETRFKGFTEKWSRKKLNWFLETSLEKNVYAEFGKNDVLSVSGEVGIVNQIEFQGRSFAGVSVANYGVVRHGDVVYTKSPLKLNPYGIIKSNNGRAGIVSTLYAVYKTKNNAVARFIEYYFCSDYRLNRYLKPLVNKGAKNDMKVTSDNALLGDVTFPESEAEQSKIDSFFHHLDTLISLQQRELDKLNNLKKACLEKMFV